MKQSNLKKVLLGILLLLMFVAVVFMFFKQTCVDRYAQALCSVSRIEGMSRAECCEQSVSVWEKLSSGEIFDTFFSVALFYSVFFVLFKLLSQVFFITFKKKNVYQKIFFVELGLILLLAFLWVSFFVVLYDGTDCLGDDCSKMSFFRFFSFWGVFIGSAVLFNPISIITLILPYVVGFIYSKKYPNGTS